jgi:anti-sigma B factor antagonist
MVKINIESYDLYDEIIVNGEVDASSSIHLDNALIESINRGANVLVNLKDLSYISSAGLGVFISHLEEIKSLGIIMILFGMNEKVEEVFNILGLSELINIKKEKQAALALIDAL